MSSTVKPHVALIACNLVWAINYPIYKLLMPHYITPLSMTTLTLVVAAIFGLSTLPFSHPEKVDKKDVLIIIGAALLMGVCRKLFLITGLSLTSPIDASIIITVGPILVLIISAIMRIDKLSTGKIIGVTLGMAGTIMVILFSGKTGSAHGGMLGNLIILFSALSTAVYMVFFKKLIAKYRPLTVLIWLYCSAAIVILPFGLDSVIHTDLSAMHGKVLWAFLFVLLVPTFLPNLMLVYSLKFVSPTVSSMYTYLQPVAATLLAMAMGLDKPTWIDAVGALVVFAGVMMVIRSYKTSSISPITHFH